MLTRIRNAVTAKHTRVDMPVVAHQGATSRAFCRTKATSRASRLLDEPPAGRPRPVKTLRLFLEYGPHGERLITGVPADQPPGTPRLFRRDDVPEVLAGLGTSILTTSRGVMTGRAAVKAGVGGEVLCNIW